MRAAPFPSAWEDILRRRVRLYRMLPPDLRRELHGHIQVFVDEKRFEGARGFEVTDEVRVTIAALACLLLLNRSAGYYPGLRSIIVYPDAFFVPTTEAVSADVMIEDEEMLIGESWDRGAVVLAWDDVVHGARNARDGVNVVLHEFAHQLDQAHGGADGVPAPASGASPEEWARVLAEEYQQLQADSDRRRYTLLDGYGATNEAEFFAVATECFFEKPRQMKRRHPDLYDQLRRYYGQDPETYQEGE